MKSQFTGTHLALAGLGGLAVGWLLGRRSGIAPAAGVLPAGQGLASGDPGEWPPTLEDGRRIVESRQDLGGCSGWSDDAWRRRGWTNASEGKRRFVRDWWDHFPGIDAFGNLRSAGMDIAHPGWEAQYIAQADAYCARRFQRVGYVVNVPVELSDQMIARFLGTMTCDQWSRLPRGSIPGERQVLFRRTKMEAASEYARTHGDPSADLSRIISAIDAYCLKRAVQATRIPQPSMNFPKPSVQ